MTQQPSETQEGPRPSAADQQARIEALEAALAAVREELAALRPAGPLAAWSDGTGASGPVPGRPSGDVTGPGVQPEVAAGPAGGGRSEFRSEVAAGPAGGGRSEFRSEVAAGPVDGGVAGGLPGAGTRSTRRALLGRVGAVAAGTAAGLVVAGAAAEPVAALPAGPNDIGANPAWARYVGATAGPAFLFEAGNGTSNGANPSQAAALAGAVTGGAAFAPTTGVFGYSGVAGGAGVAAVADSGDGVGLLAQSLGGATLRLRVGSGAPATIPPAVATWEAGDVLRTADGHLWYCTVGGVGPASRWSRLSGTGLTLLPSPVRVYDTRNGAGPFVGDTTRVVPLGGALPAGAAGALLNLTVADTSGVGYVQVYSAALGAPPATSNLNWYDSGQIVANSATTAVDAARQVKVTTQGGRAAVIVDVFGYYA